MALTYTLGQPCAGGNHWDVNVVGIGGQPITLHIQYPDLLVPLDEDELTELVALQLRLLVSKHPPTSMANIRTKLAGISIPVDL